MKWRENKDQRKCLDRQFGMAAVAAIRKAILVQACAQELSRGQQVWSQVVANDAVQSFQTDPDGAAYLAALQHIWRIALLLQAAADLHGLAETAQPQHRAAFELASRDSMGAVVGECISPYTC